MSFFLKNKKIAIIHDSFTHFGGAERFLLSLIKVFPQADLYIPIVNKNFCNLIKNELKGNLFFTFLSYFNFINPSFFKLILFYYFENLNLDKYDLVISSSHSFSSKSIKVKDNIFHLSYIHTPPRYLYLEINDMEWVKNKFFSSFLSYLRLKDYKSAQRANLLLANSLNVKKRIKKYYGRDSIVLYPSINFKKNKKIRVSKKKDYYLFVSRLVRQKGIELVVDAFNILQKKIIIVGTGPLENNLKRRSNKNIKFVGFVEDQYLIQLYRQAKALIYTSVDEDFGLVPIESMFAGTPVIAYNSGGVKESVIHNKTGILFDHYSVDGITEAINNFETMNFKSIDCIERADEFSFDRFENELLKILRENLNK